MLRVATFNVENFFTRPVAMTNATAAISRTAIEDYVTAINVVAKLLYTPEDKEILLRLCLKYDWHLSQPSATAMVQLHLVQKSLFRQLPNGEIEVIANGRADWVGWFELLRENICWRATYNKGRVISETNADIIILEEVESRPMLKRFNEQVLQAQFNAGYPYYMAIDGNEMRSMDLGVLSRYPIREIRPHINDLDFKGRRIFSRDCPEFDIFLPSGQRFILMPNHFKSKRNGYDQESREIRWEQAARAHTIALGALERSPLVLLAGDLGDSPHSTALAPLFSDGFQDVIMHPNYPTDRPGTFYTGQPINKVDYLLMSPALQNHLADTGIERRGSFHPTSWEPFDTLTSPSEKASDHFLLWADFDL